MVSSTASTVAEYLQQLAPERRAVVSAVRDVVTAHLPAGYVEAMAYGMIGWGIPLSRYPDTYNGQPLSVAGLAAQKNHYALYLHCVYTDPASELSLREAYARAGKRLDMGKSCLRFKRLDDLLLDEVAHQVGSMPPDALIAHYEAARAGQGRPC